MKQPLVSVLLANYNHEDTLEETLQSVLNQTYTNLQIIVIDDGSTDRSWDVISQIKDPRLEAYRLEKNQHVCAATNYGIRKIRGEYVARTDSDDVWYPEKIERQMEYLRIHEDSKVCFTWCDFIDEDGNNINHLETDRVRLHEAKFTNQADAVERFYFRGNCLAHSSVLMETAVMREIGDYDVGYNHLHDFDYWIRIAKKYRIDVISEKYLAVRRFIQKDSKVSNMSAMDDRTETKVFNEYMELRAHYFDDLSDELFQEAFGIYMIKQGVFTPQQLKCEKAFLLCKPQDGWNQIPPAGLRRLHELLVDPEMKQVLEEEYNFGIKDYYKLLETHMYNDQIVQRPLRQMEEQIRRLEVEKENLCQEIRLYRESTSWKVTKPLRMLESLRKK